MKQQERSGMKITAVLKLFLQAYKEWVRDRADGLAASIAYYQLMSIAPFVALIVLASSAIFGDDTYHKEVEPLITQFFHPQFIIAIKYMLQYSLNLDQGKFITITFLAVISLVHGTLGYFQQIKDSIENFWDKRTEETGFKAKMKKKAEALFMAAVCFSCFMLGFIVGHWFSRAETIFSYILMFVMEFIVLFSIIYFQLKYCPPVKIYWREVLPGAFITTILYVIGKFALRYILNNQEGAPEDVAATLIMYLLWAYYFALIFLFGAECSKLYIKKKRNPR